jgi:hypothetical protein
MRIKWRVKNLNEGTTCRPKDSVRMDLRAVGRESVGWINAAGDNAHPLSNRRQLKVARWCKTGS